MEKIILNASEEEDLPAIKRAAKGFKVGNSPTIHKTLLGAVYAREDYGRQRKYSKENIPMAIQKR